MLTLSPRVNQRFSIIGGAKIISEIFMKILAFQYEILQLKIYFYMLNNYKHCNMVLVADVKIGFLNRNNKKKKISNNQRPT
jgi:hypothetical protein